MRALDEVPLYARVDLVRLPDGTLALIELELIEPSLYLSYDVDAPERFAAAMDRFLTAADLSGAGPNEETPKCPVQRSQEGWGWADETPKHPMRVIALHWRH